MSWTLLLGLIWGLSHESLAQYCVDQPYGEESFTGGSITFPCNFTYSETTSPSSVTVIVKAGYGRFCKISNTEIYNSDSNFISSQYRDKISVQFDLTTRTSSVTIKDLKDEDSKSYCCRFILNPSNGEPIPWQHPEGTTITVKGEKEMILKQESFILALPGDTVTIISRFTLKNQTMTPNVTECGLFRGPDSNGCGNRIYPVTWTQGNHDNIVFVKINGANNSYNGFYCFYMNASVGGSNYSGQRNNGSQLLVLERGNSLKINQTPEVEFRGPVIINCSFSIQHVLTTGENGSVLWTQVFWMVGEPREHFVYHPNEDYIHPEYKGKTKLIDQTNLLLEDFHGPDNTTLYCRVAIRFCLATSGSPNRIDTILEEGLGTLLRVQDNSEVKPQEQQLPLQTIIIASCVGCAVLLFSILLIICLKTRKDKKRSNSGETIVESIDASVYQNSGYENVEKFQKQSKETDEKMVYAMVKHSKTTAPKKPQVLEEPEVVYAAVKK